MLTRRQRLCTPRGLRGPRVGFPRSRAASTAPAPPRWPGTLTSGAEGFLSLAAPSRLSSLCAVRTRPAPSLRQPFTALPLFLVPSSVDTMLLSLRGFCFVTAFSRRNSRNVKFTVLKCTIQWLLVCSQNRASVSTARLRTLVAQSGGPAPAPAATPVPSSVGWPVLDASLWDLLLRHLFCTFAPFFTDTTSFFVFTHSV